MDNFKEKVIIALDYNNLDSVKKLLKTLSGEAYFYKIGFELFTACGIQAVETVKNQGCKVFLDLKFHDIPNTVYKAVKTGAMLGADIINVHASGGVEMMKAAREGGIEASEITGRKIDVIAVTVLTSLKDEDLEGIFFCNGNGIKNNKLENLVMRLAGLAKNSGLDGVVCSGHEVLEIKKVLGDNFKTIVPGIRLKKAGEITKDSIKIKSTGRDDQKRTMAPGEAFNYYGADYIVAGREITAAVDPLEALNNVFEDIYKSKKI